MMLNAAKYSQARVALIGKVAGTVLVGALKSVKATTPRIKSVSRDKAATPSPAPLTITVNGILPDLDKAVADVAGVLVAAWQNFGVSPQPVINDIQFEDETIVGQVDGSSSSITGEEPGLVQEDWILSIPLSLPTAAIAGLLGDSIAAAVGKEVLVDVGDFLTEQLLETASEALQDEFAPGHSSPDMGVSDDPDMSTDDNPIDNGSSNTNSDPPTDNNTDNGNDDPGGGGGKFVPGEDGTLPTVMPADEDD